MKRSEAFPSKYLSKDDVDPAVVWTIAKVVKVEMDDEDGGKKNPPVMYFTEPESKPYIMNNTTWMTCEDLYGPDSDGWTGHQIECYKDPSVMFGGKRVGGVRVRKPNGNGNGNHSANTVEVLADLRAQIKAAGGTVHPLTKADVETPEKLAAQIEAHRHLLADALIAGM